MLSPVASPASSCASIWPELAVASGAVILVTSRSFEEYVAFFDLDPETLPPRVLDCCAGTSGFVAEAHARGVEAVALDPAYRLDGPALVEDADRGAHGAQQILDTHDQRFTYDWYGTRSRRVTMRRNAFGAFAAHRRGHPSHYLPAVLPQLPFADDAFDLALCSHLLFTWATVLDEHWHHDALVELCRVAAEVRVFPLLLQGAGEPVPFLASLRTRLSDNAIDSHVVTVPYEFQVGGNEMLRLRRQR